MKAKKRAAIEGAVHAAVRLAIEQEKSRTTYSVLSIRFADGRGIDVPYLPWNPRKEITLPGRWVVDE